MLKFFDGPLDGLVVDSPFLSRASSLLLLLDEANVVPKKGMTLVSKKQTILRYACEAVELGESGEITRVMVLARQNCAFDCEIAEAMLDG